jgi:nucleoside permease NupC
MERNDGHFSSSVWSISNCIQSGTNFMFGSTIDSAASALVLTLSIASFLKFVKTCVSVLVAYDMSELPFLAVNLI